MAEEEEKTMGVVVVVVVVVEVVVGEVVRASFVRNRSATKIRLTTATSRLISVGMLRTTPTH